MHCRQNPNKEDQMSRRSVSDEDVSEVTVAEGDDADNPNTFDHPDAEAVREGRLSAAQMSGGHGNVDSNNPDAQYPPGVIQNTT